MQQIQSYNQHQLKLFKVTASNTWYIESLYNKVNSDIISEVLIAQHNQNISTTATSTIHTNIAVE